MVCVNSMTNPLLTRYKQYMQLVPWTCLNVFKDSNELIYVFSDLLISCTCQSGFA